MKRVGIYFLLTLYLTVQLKPLSALVQDLLAHTFWKVHHLANTHHEHGHDHLHDELKAISEEDDDDHHHAKNQKENIPAQKKSTEEIAYHVLSENEFNIQVIHQTCSHHTNLMLNIEQVFFRPSSPPPKF